MATTIVRFLMGFIIQNAQTRDARATSLSPVKGTKTGKVRLEEMTDRNLCALAGDFEKLRSRLAAALLEPHVSSMTKRPAANVMPEGSESKEWSEPRPPAPGNNYRIFPQELLGESTKASRKTRRSRVSGRLHSGRY
jgi:hypothetical protein